jgi:hypothetical protein
MPRPTADNRDLRRIDLYLPSAFVRHCEDQAEYLGCSRVDVIRQLIRRDMERQGPGRASVKA